MLRIASFCLSVFLFLIPSAVADENENPLGSHRFSDFNLDFKPSLDQYAESLFRLSQDYPKTFDAKNLEPAIKQILSIDYEHGEGDENWKSYLSHVLNYCKDGNVEAKWKVHNNKVRKWYHVPWQHYGDKGREGINGLTREATAKPKQLAPTQKDSFDTYAVALYNEPGGYTIGDVWSDQYQPNPKKARFPDGTVVFKLLFIQATVDQVPYLANPITWKVYGRDPKDQTKRIVQDVRLIQVDVMVRDPRADPTGGWVFGTYCYNGSQNREDKWDNLVPVGLQWGNDPSIDDPDDNREYPEPTKTDFNRKLRETVINESQNLPAQHLGWGGRLNGPVDYYRSSCMSCHSTAQYPSFVEGHPDFEAVKFSPSDPQWAMWFRNMKCGEAFNPMFKHDKRHGESTDFSLQLAIGINHFYEWKGKTMGGYFTPVLPGKESPSERTESFVPKSEPPSRSK